MWILNFTWFQSYAEVVKILSTPGNSNAQEESSKSENQLISKSLTKKLTS